MNVDGKNCKPGNCACNNEKVSQARRGFLKSAAVTAGVALAPGITLYAFGGGNAEARPLDAPASTVHRWGMLIDVNKCEADCDRCVAACSDENGWQDTGRPQTDPQWIRKITLTDPKNGSQKSLPMMCQHCEHPPCVDVCPTGASFKRADGIVLVDRHICIGCRYCMMACPYSARAFVHEPLTDQKAHAPRGKGCVESCTLCVHRVDAGRQPACVEACAAEADEGGAILFGDLNDPNSEIARKVAKYASTQVRSDLGTNPGVHYTNL